MRSIYSVIVRCKGEQDFYDFDDLDSAVGYACGVLDRQEGESVEGIQKDGRRLYSAREVLALYQDLEI